MNNRFLALFLALALIVSGFSSVPVVLAQAVTVAITAPAAGATLVVGQPTVFTAQATGGSGAYSYVWAFGDSTSGAGPTFVKTYNAVGDYAVTVTATETGTQQGSANLTVHVVAGTNPNPTTLTISNVRVTDVTSNSAVVRWETNIPASSRVIYDTVSHASLGTAPNYGYANSTTVANTAPNGVTTHAVTVSGLAPATTYYFRAISQ